MEYLIFIAIGTIIVVTLAVVKEKRDSIKHQDMLDQMTPENRAKYDKKIEEDQLKREKEVFLMVYGNLNPELICPHCQTRGVVHTRKYAQDIVTTGKIGGILKTNIKTTTKTWVNQHHCTQCKTTWNI